MSRARLAASTLAFACGLVVLALPLELAGRGAPRFALCALVWAACLGLPLPARDALSEAPRRGAGSALAAAAVGLGLALPELGLAAGLDAGIDGGARGASALLTGTTALALILGLAWAAELAARRGGLGRALQVATWGGLVAGAPLLAHALAHGAGGARGVPRALRIVAEASPLAWLLGAARETPVLAAATGPALVVLLTIVAALLGPRTSS